MSSTTRRAENFDAIWTKVYSYGFGRINYNDINYIFILLSLITMILITMILIWILSTDGGGLGLRGLGLGYFNWHPFLMCIAFLFFMAPATVAFDVLSPFSRNTNKTIHGILQSIAIICIIIGYVIIYDSHTVSDHGLATSMHSIAGYITIVLCVCTYAMGFYLYIMKFGESLRGELKALHKRLGLMSLFMGFASILMGMTERVLSLSGSGSSLVLLFVGYAGVGCTCVGCSCVIKFVNKKHSEFKYAIIEDIDTIKLQL